MSMPTKKLAHPVSQRLKLQRKNALRAAGVQEMWSAKSHGPLSKRAAANPDALNKMASYGLKILPGTHAA